MTYVTIENNSGSGIFFRFENYLILYKARSTEIIILNLYTGDEILSDCTHFEIKDETGKILASREDKITHILYTFANIKYEYYYSEQYIKKYINDEFVWEKKITARYGNVFRINDSDECITIPDDKIRLWYEFTKVIICFRGIHVLFSEFFDGSKLHIKCLCKENVETIMLFLHVFHKSAVKLPKYIKIYILNFAFRYYEEITGLY